MKAVIGLASLTMAMVVAAPTLRAQAGTESTAGAAQVTVPVTAVAPATAAGPRVRSVGISRAEVAPGTPAVTQGSPARRDFAWMVLGGAAVVVGGIVGGDGGTIIMVTGGVIGLIGLWRYLQYS
ncbi:MAG: hypothetical protein C0503_09455 [Gemmatimonas sp.]|nr:hypothetical protein [Gemmatimonas sp.]